MYVEIRFYQEPPWHYKPQQNGNHDIRTKKLNESDKQEETKTAIIVLRKKSSPKTTSMNYKYKTEWKFASLEQRACPRLEMRHNS